MEDKRRGSVYQDWNEDLRKRYIRILDIVIKSLIETPYYPFTITIIDAIKLQEAAAALGVDIDGDIFDVGVFFKMRGAIIKAAIEKVENHLRPTNPLDDIVKEAAGDATEDIY